MEESESCLRCLAGCYDVEPPRPKEEKGAFSRASGTMFRWGKRLVRQTRRGARFTDQIDHFSGAAICQIRLSLLERASGKLGCYPPNVGYDNWRVWRWFVLGSTCLEVEFGTVPLRKGERFAIRLTWSRGS